MLENPVIFYVEDDFDLRDLARVTLEFNFPEATIVTFADPYEALSQAIETPPDLIMLDLLLPNFSGQQFFKRIIDENISTRVIIISSNKKTSTIVETIRAGALDYLTKLRPDVNTFQIFNAGI